MYIVSSVTSIGDQAFYNCIGLTSVYYIGTVEEWANIIIGSYNECLLNATIYMHTHVYSESVVEPTCTQQGYTLHVCECGKKYTDNYVPAIGHTEVTVAGVAATCTKTGLSEGKYCSVCNTIIVAQTEIPVKEHSLVIDKAVDATCTKTGLTEGSFCSVCRTVFTKQQTIKALGHNYENGKCTNCGRIEPNYWDGTVAEGFARGSGTQDDPYIIETAAQLAYLSSSASEGNTYSGKYVALVRNIDLKGMQWTPIKSFAGNFDGNGYNISNFVIINASGYIGLFANVLSDSSLQNINLEGFTIDATYAGNIYAGGLAGSSSGTIDNCSANGSVSITTKNDNYYAYSGGLVGIQSGKTITNSYAIGTVYVSASHDTYAGGLVGNNSAAVSYCYSKCKVTAIVDSFSFHSGAFKCYIGGLIGYQSSSTISCSFATGNIKMNSSTTSTLRAGGLVGYNDGGTISNVYATGNVSATSNSVYTYSGGLVGDNADGTISNGYALGTATASSTKCYAGGLLGENDGNGKISNCYATGNTSNIGYTYYKSTATKCYNYYGKVLPTKNFLISTLGWSEEIWTFVEDGYPILKNVLC